MKAEDFRALKIKGGRTLIIKKENFDLLLNAVKRFGEDEGEEVEVTQEMLDKLKQLADAMYYEAQNLTTDASMLHKAMQDYRQFVISELKESKL